MKSSTGGKKKMWIFVKNKRFKELEGEILQYGFFNLPLLPALSKEDAPEAIIPDETLPRPLVQ